MRVPCICPNRDELGVSLICIGLPIRPSTYYTAKTRPVWARAACDVVLTALIQVIFTANYSVYGARKMWKAMRRAGEDVGRDQVARLMRKMVCVGSVGAGRCSPHTRTRPRRGHPIWSTASSSLTVQTRSG